MTDKEIHLLARLSRNRRLYADCKGTDLDALQELGLLQWFDARSSTTPLQLLTGLAQGRAGALDVGFWWTGSTISCIGGRPVCHPREQLLFLQTAGSITFCSLTICPKSKRKWTETDTKSNQRRSTSTNPTGMYSKIKALPRATIVLRSSLHRQRVSCDRRSPP